MRLLSVELTRLRWRRAVLVLAVGCLLVPLLFWAGLAYNTRPFSEQELRAAEQEVAAINEQSRRDVELCLENPREFGIPSEQAEQICPEMASYTVTVEEYLYRPELNVKREIQGTGLGVLTVLTLLVMLIGTTFAGHDWNSGSMSNQLLFEPRRLRVWATKGLAVFIAGLALAAAGLAGFWGSVGALAQVRDVPVADAHWDAVLAVCVRGGLLVALAGLGGYALTMFFRSTVATLGILFAVTLAGSMVVLTVLGDAGLPWLLPSNYAAVVFDGFEYFDPSVPCRNPMEGCDQTSTLSQARGASYLGVLLAAAVSLSLWSFRRRDVP